MDFQPFCAGPETLFEPLCFAPAPVFIINAAEIQQSERQEATGMCLVQCGESFFQTPARSAVEVDNCAYSSGIHLGKIVFHSLGREPVSASAQVIVNVDNRVRRRLDIALFCLEHRAGLPVTKLKLANIIGRLGKSH